MTPIYFGSSAKRLFGLYESARGGEAVLFCHAWGAEYLNSYRAVRFAASRFVAAGFSALRFDYYGSGDSDGETTEVDLQSFEGDIETAIDELRELARTRSVVLFGMRLGATLALRVATRAPGAVSRLVLWDPIVVGADYVDALAAKARRRIGVRAEPPKALAPGAPVDLDGLRVSPAFLSALRAIDLASAPLALPAGTVVVNTVAGRGSRAPGLAFPPLSRAAVTLSSPAPAPWADDPDLVGALPVNAIQQIIGALR